MASSRPSSCERRAIATPAAALAGARLHGARDLRADGWHNRWHGAGAEHQVVGGAFALLQKFAPGHPGQRIPPVQRQRGARQQMSGRIAAPYVRQFVQQHDAAALVAPRRGLFGQQDGGPQHAEGHRHARRGLQHVHRMLDPEAEGERVGLVLIGRNRAARRVRQSSGGGRPASAAIRRRRPPSRGASGVLAVDRAAGAGDAGVRLAAACRLRRAVAHRRLWTRWCGIRARIGRAARVGQPDAQRRAAPRRAAAARAAPRPRPSTPYDAPPPSGRAAR